jgi:ribosome-associated toxin RatA of RatAB toxin-antitoxin module
MDTSIERTMRADPRTVLALAAAVEDWPRILPHYGRVRVVRQESATRRIVEMAARRDVIAGLSVPLRWTARQEVCPETIVFEHIGGVTRGMWVSWTFERMDSGAIVVRIRHVFKPAWPVPAILVRAILGEYFVNGVARRTLARIAEIAEARALLASTLNVEHS